MVTTFGKEVEGALDDAADGAKTKREIQRRRGMVLARYLKNEDGSRPAGTFRDPAAR